MLPAWKGYSPLTFFEVNISDRYTYILYFLVIYTMTYSNVAILFISKGDRRMSDDSKVSGFAKQAIDISKNSYKAAQDNVEGLLKSRAISNVNSRLAENELSPDNLSEEEYEQMLAEENGKLHAKIDGAKETVKVVASVGAVAAVSIFQSVFGLDDGDDA